MKRRPATRSRLLAALLGAAGLVGAASPVQAVEVDIRWTHPNAGEVDHFELVYGFASRQYDSTVGVGAPAQSGGIYHTVLDVRGGVDVYLAIVAVNAQGQPSAPSNERIYFVPGSGSLSAPGRPIVEEP